MSASISSWRDEQVTAVPDVVAIDRGAEHEFMLLASDGVFTFLPDQV